jgi:hypothetical protein
MGKISDLVSRGVKVIAGEGAGVAPLEIPAEAFRTAEGVAPVRFQAGTDVEDLATVYREAGVPAPFRGYGIDKLVEILESRRLSALPREVRISAVLASLDAAGVSLGDVLRDAVARDRALDDFVSAKQREADGLKGRNETRVSSLREEVEQFVAERRAEIDRLQGEADTAASAYAQLELRKRQEIERLREVLGHFLDDARNPIPSPGNDRKPAKAGA